MRKGLGVSLILTLLLGLGLAGCGDEEIVEVEKVPVIRVTVVVTPDSLDTGAMATVEATATVSGGKAATLSYSWEATGGSFVNDSADSTTWITPDAGNMYTVSCVVTDGENVGIGTKRVFVGDYVPTVTPFYVGASTCATCHAGGPGGDQYTPWSMTIHATALSALTEIGQDHNATCLACHTVGSMGLDADPSLDNGGYDDQAVERLANVQCENCHGPGSEHPQNDFSSVEVSFDAAVCGECHTDAHHPTYDEWQESAHAAALDLSGSTRTTCAHCHNGYYGAQFLDDPEGYSSPATVDVVVPIVCQTCHDPHHADNPGQLRDASAMDIALPNSPLIPSAGAGRLCMACHNGRRSSEDVAEMIESGSAHFGPHHAVQGDMLAGVNAVEDVDTIFTFASSRHILVEDGCVNCHTHHHEVESPSEAEPNYTGHSFEPTVEACEPCHGTLGDFTDLMAKKDYDGNGSVEGVQTEVEGLLVLLEETIADVTEDAGAQAALEADFEGTIGDTMYARTGAITEEQRMAGYNWAYVSYDGSKGVHNATYAIQLLQQSIEAMDPTVLSGRGAFVLKQP